MGHVRLWFACLAVAAVATTACGTGQIIGTGGADAGPGGGGGGGDPEFGEPDAACAETQPIMVSSTIATPDVMLLVDKSGSMAEPLGTSAQVKWDVMRTALSAVVPAHDATIRWGLMSYPPDGQCGAAALNAPIAPMNSSAVVGALGGITPDGATPTQYSVAAAGAVFASLPVNPDGRYLLLATDGLPNCNGGDPQAASDAASIAAVQALAAQGILTFVIGFGSGVTDNPATLQAMAEAGGTDHFYAADSATELQAALDAISGTVTTVSCTFTLATTPEDPDKLTVTIDGIPIPRDTSHATGWDYDASTNSITFFGDTCTQLGGGTAGAVGVDYGCGGPIIG
jgi:hypothetical protein